VQIYRILVSVRAKTRDCQITDRASQLLFDRLLEAGRRHRVSAFRGITGGQVSEF
jgi:hypothetical protein